MQIQTQLWGEVEEKRGPTVEERIFSAASLSLDREVRTKHVTVPDIKQTSYWENSADIGQFSQNPIQSLSNYRYWSQSKEGDLGG